MSTFADALPVVLLVIALYVLGAIVRIEGWHIVKNRLLLFIFLALMMIKITTVVTGISYTATTLLDTCIVGVILFGLGRSIYLKVSKGKKKLIIFRGLLPQHKRLTAVTLLSSLICNLIGFGLFVVSKPFIVTYSDYITKFGGVSWAVGGILIGLLYSYIKKSSFEDDQSRKAEETKEQQPSSIANEDK